MRHNRCIPALIFLLLVSGVPESLTFHLGKTASRALSRHDFDGDKA